MFVQLVGVWNLKAPPAEAYQQVSDDDDWHDEGQTQGQTGDLHAVPEDLNPWSRQYSEDAEEGVEESAHVPSRIAVLWNFTHWILVALVKQLVTDCDESIEDDEQKKRISQHDLEEHMELMPPSSQPEKAQLRKNEPHRSGDSWGQRETGEEKTQSAR